MNHAGQAQRKGKGPYRILLTILTGIAGIALFGCILLMSQSRMAELALQEEMKENSSYITNAFTYYEASGKTIQSWSDSYGPVHENQRDKNQKDHKGDGLIIWSGQRRNGNSVYQKYGNSHINSHIGQKRPLPGCNTDRDDEQGEQQTGKIHRF